MRSESLPGVLVSLVIFICIFLITPISVFAATTRVDLGTADNFAILAGSTIPDTNPSVIVGDVGLSPSTGAGIGLTCGEVTGAIYTVAAAGPLPCRVANAGLLTNAKNDLTTAFNNASGRTTTSTIGTQLGGATLTDGVYDSASTTFTISGITPTLTLNGQGNADSVFIFKMGSTLVTGSASSVVLTNGAQACNVFWQVGDSATLGTGTTFIGNIMADQSITDNGSSVVDGRLLASVAAVTLNNTHVTKSSCATTSSTTSSSPSSSSGGSASTISPPLSDSVISPTIIDSRRISPTSIFISWSPYSGVDKFNVQYGFENGQWLFNTNVTGFSTTINNLPPNLPIFFRVAARNDSMIGKYGPVMVTGGPVLPSAGVGPDEDIDPWSFQRIIINLSFIFLKLIRS